MSRLIRLLGPPAVERDGAARRPRGRKTWALLAYLLLAERPPSRSRLTDLCFPEASDPRAALRTLADLRRLLGADVDLSGGLVGLRLPANSVIDVHLVLASSPAAGLVAALDGELLEGQCFPSSAPLELWLGCQRRRLAAACQAQVRAAANDARRNGSRGEAARVEAQLIALNPFGGDPRLDGLPAHRPAMQRRELISQEGWTAQRCAGGHPGPAPAAGQRAGCGPESGPQRTGRAGDPTPVTAAGGFTAGAGRESTAAQTDRWVSLSGRPWPAEPDPC